MLDRDPEKFPCLLAVKLSDRMTPLLDPEVRKMTQKEFVWKRIPHLILIHDLLAINTG